MTVRQERVQILTMLKENKISVEEAARLLEAVDGGHSRQAPRNLIIQVTEEGVDRVNATLPLSLARTVLPFIPADVLAQYDIDIETLIAEMEAGAHGPLIEIEDASEGRKVKIFVE